MGWFRDNAVMVAAHRGGRWQLAPENSLQSFEECIALGVDILELDIRWTAERELIVMHDPALDRTTTGTGLVEKWRIEDIRKLCLRDRDGTPTSHRIATLREVLKLAKGRCMVYLDKSSECIPEVLSVLKDTDTAEQAILYGDSTIEEVRSRIGEMLDVVHYLPQINDHTPGLTTFVDTFLRKCRPSAFMVKYENEQSPVLAAIQTIRKEGVHVWASPLKPSMCGGRTDVLALEDPDGNWGRIVSQGVDIICTDYPVKLLTYLRTIGMHR